MTEHNTANWLDVGWREWVALPELGIGAIKAKIDTGARTSAIHAIDIEEFQDNGLRMIRFSVPPLRRQGQQLIACCAPVKDRRLISNSGGHREWRYVITTALQIGPLVTRIELTLTNRESMLFRMLLGRTAMQQLRVCPTASYLTGKQLYRNSRQQQKTEAPQ